MRGGALGLIGGGVSLSLRLLGTIALARLLAPEEFGLIVMVSAVVGFLGIFKDLGLAAATVQRDGISLAQVSALFWINLALGGLLALLAVAAAPGVAWFYDDPRLVLVSSVLGLRFLFVGASIQHEALLRRRLRIGALTSIEVVSNASGLVLALALAWHGAGYWALVAQGLCASVVGSAGLWIVSGWRPGRFRRDVELRSLLGFGRNLTGFQLLNYTARNLDNVLIGRVWGAGALGIYSRAYTLLMLPILLIISPLTSVAVPTLSRLQGEPERYRRTYRRILEKLALVSMPCVAFMAACCDWLIELALGPQWMEAADVFFYLALAALVQPISSSMGWLFVTQGRTREQLRAGLLGGCLTMASIVAGLPYGPQGVAAAYAGVNVVVRAPLLWWLAGLHGPVRTRDIYAVLPLPLAAACSVLAALTAMRALAPELGPLAGVAAGLGVAVTAMGAVVVALPAGRRAFQDLALLMALLRAPREAGR